MFKDDVAVIHCKDMTDAVSKAGQCAKPGDIVLLSPGCASFDMYDSYAHRGQSFETAVHQIKSQMV